MSIAITQFLSLDGNNRIYIKSLIGLSDEDKDVINNLFNCFVETEFNLNSQSSSTTLPSPIPSSAFSCDLIEVGPMLFMETPWGSNAKSILEKCGIHIQRIEQTRIYNIIEFDDNCIDKMSEIKWNSDTITTFFADEVKRVSNVQSGNIINSDLIKPDPVCVDSESPATFTSILLQHCNTLSIGNLSILQQ